MILSLFARFGGWFLVGNFLFVEFAVGLSLELDFLVRFGVFVHLRRGRNLFLDCLGLEGFVDRLLNFGFVLFRDGIGGCHFGAGCLAAHGHRQGALIKPDREKPLLLLIGEIDQVAELGDHRLRPGSAAWPTGRPTGDGGRGSA